MSVNRMSLAVFLHLLVISILTGQSYKIVDTGQNTFSDNNVVINEPLPGEAF